MRNQILLWNDFVQCKTLISFRVLYVVGPSKHFPCLDSSTTGYSHNPYRHQFIGTIKRVKSRNTTRKFLRKIDIRKIWRNRILTNYISRNPMEYIPDIDFSDKMDFGSWYFSLGIRQNKIYIYMLYKWSWKNLSRMRLRA